LFQDKPIYKADTNPNRKRDGKKRNPESSRYYAPLPFELLFKITNGVYYDIRKSNSCSSAFLDSFGVTFQEYVYALLSSSQLNEIGWRIIQIPESDTNEPGDRRCDYACVFGIDVLLIECKSTFFKEESRVELKQNAVKSGVNRLRKAFEQCIATATAISEKRVIDFPEQSYYNFYPLVVSWEINSLFQIDYDVPSSDKYNIYRPQYCNINAFEYVVETWNSVSPVDFFESKCSDPNYSKDMNQFMEEMAHVNPSYLRQNNTMLSTMYSEFVSANIPGIMKGV